MTQKTFFLKTVLITGASSGIGAALALYYAEKGRTLLLTGRNHARLDAVGAACLEKGAQVETATLDVSERQAMQDWIAAMDSKHALDLVIANAGISGGTGSHQGPLHGEHPEQVRQIFKINLDGVLNTVEPALPFMLARGRGQIAIMSSLASFGPWPGAPAYGASKGAVRLYGEALRGALMHTGVRINVICPGFVESRITAANDFPMPFFMSADKAARLIAKGLAKNKARIAFPFSSYFLAGFLGVLPPGFVLRFLCRLPRKPAGLKT